MTTTTKRPHETSGAVLRAMRDGAGMTQRALAGRAGYSHQHLARIESGECALTTDVSDHLARAIADHILERTA